LLSPAPKKNYVSPFSKSEMSSLKSLVKLTVRCKNLFESGTGIVVAVSGGPDSVCLLHILYLLSSEWDLALEVAHFEHGLRGSESRGALNPETMPVLSKGCLIILGSVFLLNTAMSKPLHAGKA